MTKLGLAAFIFLTVLAVGCKKEEHVSSPDKPSTTSTVDWKNKSVAETATIPKAARDRVMAALKAENVETGGGYGENVDNIKIHFKKADEAKVKTVIDADAKANSYSVTYS